MQFLLARSCHSSNCSLKFKIIVYDRETYKVRICRIREYKDRNIFLAFEILFQASNSLVLILTLLANFSLHMQNPLVNKLWFVSSQN